MLIVVLIQDYCTIKWHSQGLEKGRDRDRESKRDREKKEWEMEGMIDG